MLDALQSQNSQSVDTDASTVTIVDSAYKKFLGKEITYNVSIYEAAEGVEVTDALWKLSKSKAASHESLTKSGTAVIVIDESTGTVVRCIVQPAK